MAIALLITGTGIGFCEESKKSEIQNSQKQSLKEQVESKVSKGKIAKAAIGIVFFLQCLWDWQCLLG